MRQCLIREISAYPVYNNAKEVSQATWVKQVLTILNTRGWFTSYMISHSASCWTNRIGGDLATRVLAGAGAVFGTWQKVFRMGRLDLVPGKI